MSNKKSFLGGIVTGVLAAALILNGVFMGRSAWNLFQASRAQEAASQSAAENTGSDTVANQRTMDKLKLLEDTIGKYYLESVDEQTLEKGVYDGLVKALGDPYSVYYSAEELKELQDKTEGIYYGIGAYIGIDADTSLPRLTGIIEGTPAQESGLRAGDLLYKVDGEEVQGLELTQVVSKVKGEEGTTVHLTIIREGESDYLEIDVVRRKVESPTVNQKMLDNNIGYIQITEFDTVTLDQFTEALAVCRGSGMKGLILDLRGNPGGNLNTVCDIAREILPKGLIVYTEDKNGKRTEYTCDGTNQIKEPLVVLVDSGSASASEILAGSAVKLTVSNYYTPNGNNIHKIGIAPDIEEKFDGEAYYNDGVDNQLNKAIEVMNGKLGDGQ